MFKNLVALLIGCMVALLALEVVLRIIPNKFTDYGKTIYPKPEPGIGFTLKANAKLSMYKQCLRIDGIHTNSKGFRDREWGEEDYQFAVLGDSFMQAAVVSEGDYTARILEKLTGKNALNGSISGYGTVHQYLTYKRYFKKIKPKIVLLFFLTNDVGENGCKTHGSIDEWGAKFKACSYYDPESKSYAIRPPLEINLALQSFFKENCRLCLFIKRLDAHFSVTKQTLRRGSGVPKYWEVYQDKPSKDWEESWDITEHYMKKLRDAVKRDGGELVVVSIPEHIRVSKNWEEEFLQETGLDKLPNGFDPYYPTNKMEKITRRNEIAFLKLEPHFNEYRDNHDLSHPFYGYGCDGHWNPLGHFLASNFVTKFLLESGRLEIEDQEEALTQIVKNINSTPVEILGEEAYRQIYDGRIYHGTSQIDDILLFKPGNVK